MRNHALFLTFLSLCLRLSAQCLPTSPGLNDVTRCGSGSVTITASTPLGTTVWLDSAQQIVDLGTSFSFNATEDREIYAFNVTGSPTSNITFPTLTSTTYGYLAYAGMVFTTNSSFIIESFNVTTGTTATGNGSIELFEVVSGVDVLRDVYTFTSLAANLTHTLSPQFAIGGGTATRTYKLKVNLATGGGLKRTFTGATFPRNYPLLSVISAFTPSSNNATAYGYLYDWVISQPLAGCMSAIDTALVTVTPQPSVNLGQDVYICGSSYTLDAGNAGATYLWSDNSTNQTLNATSSGTYSVTATLGTCSASDAINVTITNIPGTPGVSDLIKCGGGSTTLTATTPAGTTIWRDNLMSPVASGASYTFNATQNTLLYAENIAGLSPTNISFPTPASTSFLNTSNSGQAFTTQSDLILQSVNVEAGTSGATGTLSLYEMVGTTPTLVNSLPFTGLAASTIHTLTPNFVLTSGKNYRLLVSFTSGSFRRTFGTGTTYPLNFAGVMSITEGISNNTSTTAGYFYLYDWVVLNLTGGCHSASQSALVTVAPQPSVNLGQDVSICGSSYTLDAGNAGATYLWSDNSTNQILNVNNSGTYSVTATLGTCSASDAINVTITNLPVEAGISDLIKCGAGSTTLTAATPVGTTVWMDNLQNIVYLGSSYTFNATQSTTIYAQNIANVPTTNIVFPSTANTSFLNSSNSGQAFTTQADLILQSLNVEVGTAAASGTLSLYEVVGANSTLVATLPFTNLATSTIHTLSPNFALGAGKNYTLLVSFTAGSFRRSFGTGTTYPLNFPGVLSITSGISAGTSTTAGYFYLYDWVVLSPAGGCASSLDSALVTVAPQPIVDLGQDASICGSSYILDAGNPGATYLWNNSSSNQILNVTSSGTYFVAATLGTCSDADTVNVTITIPPIQPNTNDITQCGGNNLNFIATNSTGTTVWTNSAGELVGLGSNITLDLTQSQSIYVENVIGITSNTVTFPLSTSTTQFSNIQNAGVQFTTSSNLILESFDVYTGSAAPVTGQVILLENIAGIDYQRAVLNFSNLPVNDTITLYPSFTLTTGRNYKLITTFTGQLRRNIFSSNPYPQSFTGLSMTNALPIGPGYYYFYNWVVSNPLAGCSSVKDSSVVTVLQQPIVDLGATNQTICTGNILTLDAGNPGATYLWSNNTTSPTLNVSNTGAYSLTVNYGVCSAKDSVYVLAAPLPSPAVVPPIERCGPGSINLSTSNSPTGTILWYNEVGSLIGSGTNFPTSISDTSDFAVQVANGLQSSQYGPDTTAAQTPKYSKNSSIGLIFNANQAFYFGSVDIYSRGNFTGNITVTTNGVTQTKAVNVVGQGKHTIPLDLIIPSGVGHRILMNVVAGDSLLYSSNFNFNGGLNLGNLATLTASSIAGSPNTSVFYYFYNWSIGSLDNSCATPLDTFTAIVNPIPYVDLGVDTSFCTATSYVLNAGNPNATYLWNTGATTQSITVNTTDVYTVTTTLGNCSSQDSTFVGIFTSPSAPLPLDENRCGPGLVNLSASNTSNYTVWLDSTLNLIAFGANTDAYFEQTEQVYVANVSGFTLNTLQIPLTSAPVYAASNAGLSFVALEDLVLKEFVLYSDTAATAVNAKGTAYLYKTRMGVDYKADSVDFDFAPNSVATIPANFVLQNGDSCKLVANFIAGKLKRNSYTTYPYTFPNRLKMLQSVPTNNFYNYFYSLVLGNPMEGCVSSLDSAVMTIRPIPTVPINLGVDTTACNSLMLDAGNPGYSYNWSTGATTQTISATATGWYWVDVAPPGQCSVRDSILVGINTPPVVDFDVYLTGGLDVNLFNNSNFSPSCVWSFDNVPDSNFFCSGGDYSFTTYGIHTICLTLSNDCGSNTQCESVGVYPVGLVDGSNFDWQVYPNPSSQFVNIEVKDLTSSSCLLEILDMSGKLVLSVNAETEANAFRSQINVSELAEGVYTCRLSANNKMQSKKLMIVR